MAAEIIVEEYIKNKEYVDRPLIVDSYKIISGISMFLTTYRAKITNINRSINDMKDIFFQGDNISKPLVVLNTNFGSKSVIGYEHLIKHKKVVGVRKTQGTGVVFSSAIEPGFEVKLKDGQMKIFKMNYFPTEELKDPQDELNDPELAEFGKKKKKKKKIIKRKTTVESGDEVQVPGSREIDFSDAKHVVQLLITRLNSLKICDKQIEMIDSYPEMINIKFIIHDVFYNDDKMLDVDFMYEQFVTEPRIVSIADPVDSGKLSFRFKTLDNHPKPPKICIFHMTGKVNIFGAKCYEHANEICQFLEEQFLQNGEFICERLLSDAELAKLAKKKKNVEVKRKPTIIKKLQELDQKSIDYD
jgi:hypothetical protein